MTEQLRKDMEVASHLLVRSHYVVAVVGAGMSAESGIPTYRGAGGVWTRIGEPDPRSYQNFLADPKGWWERSGRRVQPQERSSDGDQRAQLFRGMQDAQPNPGHYALVDLERMGVVRHVITQNVDNLHRVAGQQNLAEIHGNRTLLRCIQCNHRIPREEFAIVELPPCCPQCGGVIKGDGVMFGEPIPRDTLAVCLEQVNRCDCMLVLGTSGTVYPTAGFPYAVYQRGGFLVEVNTTPTPVTEIAHVALQAPTGEVLPRVAARVRELLAERARPAEA